MRKTCLNLGILAGMAVLSGCSSTTLCRLSVDNNLNETRTEEMAEVPLGKLGISRGSDFVVAGKDGREVPYQITYDNKLIFPVNIPANGKAEYKIKKGRAAKVAVTATGRRYPERLDDMAWENDKAAYRAYGPALQAKGEKGFGYDLMNKRVAYPVLESRYAKDLDPVARKRVVELRKEGRKAEADSLAASMSYHIDHGDGMDCYSVGPTLGGGTSALLDGKNIVYPYCYDQSQVLDNGPLRFTVKLVFKPEKVGGDNNVVETRVISLDKGSYLNKTVVSYSGLSKARPVVAGIVLHPQNKDGYHADNKARFIAYADSTDNPRNGNGVIYVGAAFPNNNVETYVEWFGTDEQKLRPGALGHILGRCDYVSGKPFTYYWGCGWSKNGVSGYDAWNSYMASFVRKAESPLKITVKH